MRTVLKSALAALLISAAASAQTDVQRPELTNTFLPHAAPRHFKLELATGELHEVGKLDDQQQGVDALATLTYDNSCTSGFFTSRPVNNEVQDWGVKAGGVTDIVRSFTFGYATREGDTSVGGTGANLDISFFSGTTGFGVAGTEVARFSFSGLPGSAVVGNVSAYLISVDLEGGFEFCLPDGPIGYSYCNRSDVNGSGPLIGSIASCPLGQTDAFDSYTCGLGTFNGTFFFGGSPQATFYMEINEDDGSQIAAQNFEFGSGTNVNTLLDSGPPVLGSTWDPGYVDTAGINAGGSGTGTSTLVWFSGRLPNGTVFLNQFPSGPEVLVDPTSVFLFQDSVAITGFIADHAVPVPSKDLSLLNLGTFYVQGIRLGGGAPIALSTMIEANVGF